MSARRLAHQLLDDDRVLISFVGSTHAARVNASEARRFAWALLNDLDPEEADANGYTPPPPEDKRRCLSERDYRPGGWQQREVLEAIRAGYVKSPQIANRLGVSSTQTCVQLNRLMHAGKVRKVVPGKSYSPGIWGLTEAGERALAEMTA